MKKTGYIFISFILLFSVVICLGISSFPGTEPRAGQLIFLSDLPGEAVHPHHEGDTGIADDNFFRQTEPCGSGEFLIHCGISHRRIIAFPLICAGSFWHPPKSA
jgi:hypothetical protein